MVGYLGDSVFKNLVLPYLVELYAVVKPNNRIFHSDGTLQWIWKTICKEVDVLFSFDPSLDIDKIRQENKDIFLIGNIDPVKIMLEEKSEEIVKISWEKIRAGGKNFALGLGGELVSGTPEENIKVISYLQDEF
jgi:uroporphyrinogen-III decarboxylase